MAYVRCPICKEYGFTDPPLMHRCKPLFYARDLDGDYTDEWMAVYADNAERAAEKWLEKIGPEGECSVSVVVRDANDNLSRFEVDAEYVLEFSARQGKLSEDERARLLGEEEDEEVTP